MKNLHTKISSLLAGHGGGKSAALGVEIAGAITTGCSNIFVTAPSPENLKTLFEFVCKGFEMLQYTEHLEYDVVKSANPDFKKSIVRINIYRQHRQTIQYIQPHEHEKLSQVELLVVDEAAAIPLPIVKFLLGPSLIFLSSTVNGYEGTRRSLSLKLLQQLEQQDQIANKKKWILLFQVLQHLIFHGFSVNSAYEFSYEQLFLRIFLLVYVIVCFYICPSHSVFSGLWLK